MNQINSLVDKISILFFGRYLENGFYKKPANWEKDTYVLESVFPDKDTMEEALKAIQSK